MRQARKEVPRWRRPKPGTPSGPVITIKGRGSHKTLSALAATMPAQGTQAPAAAPASALARSSAYRFRWQLVPLGWLATVLSSGMPCYWAHSMPAAFITGLLTTVSMWLFVRHQQKPPVLPSALMVILPAAWIPAIGAEGMGRPVPFVLLLSWLPIVYSWCRHYRIRREHQPKLPDMTDHVRWGQLAAEKKWNATLGEAEPLPGGGARYPILADGIKTTIGNVLSASENVAGAWHKPMTEAYAERSPDGITSRGFLTVLSGDSLMNGREWDGAGIDPETGMAVVGRFADGKPAHVKFLARRYGTRHGLASGTTGAGKSEFLNLLIFIAIISGFVPVVLDPQEGQSLPFWNGRCLYAAGRSECIAAIGGLHSGMLGRSRHLARLPWNDSGVPMKGLPFFDADLTGLPPVLIIFDEAHMIMRGQDKASRQAVEQTLEIGRLGRKTGTALWLGTHLPSLSDLGGEQALRDMLRGGNVISFRTANSVASGMLGLEKDPSLIPQYFRNGKETAGLNLLAGPDNRPDAPMRTDIVPAAMKRHVTVPALDERFASAMDSARAFTGIQVPMTVTAPPPLTPVPDAPPGRTAADAILAVLDRQMTRNEIHAAVNEYAGREWDRTGYGIRAIGDALQSLRESDAISQPKERGPYFPKRGSVRLLAGTGHARSEESAG